MIIVSQLIEELDSLGIIVFVINQANTLINGVEASSLSSADKRVNGIWICLEGFLSSISDGVCLYIFF
jgi:hypothetical protein